MEEISNDSEASIGRLLKVEGDSISWQANSIGLFSCHPADARALKDQIINADRCLFEIS